MPKQDLLSYIREGRTMTRSERLRLIVELSVPSILAQISATVMFFIDASMVGHLGEKATAAIGLVETTMWLIGGLSSSVNMGFSVQVAHFIGANDFDSARRVLRKSLVCALTWSVLVSLVGIAIHRHLPFWLGGSAEIARDASLYFLLVGVSGIFFQMEGLAGSMLKCSGNMKVPSALNILMCAMDVCFNYIFIYILGMGVAGAALGTGMAMLVTAALMMYFLFYRSALRLTPADAPGPSPQSLPGRPSPQPLPAREGSSYSHGEFSADSLSTPLPHREGLGGESAGGGSAAGGRVCRGGSANIVSTAFKIGAPMALNHILMGSAQVVSTIIVAPLGTVAIAANSLAITVESLCYMPGYGISEAATTLVGQGIGAGQTVLTRSFARMSVGLGIAVMTFMGILMWIFAPELMAMMTPVEEVIAEGAGALRIEAWAEPMFAAAIVANGVFIGAGDTLKPAIMNIVSMWGVRLTLASWLAREYGLRGVWTAMAIELSFRGSIFLARLFRGSWMR